MVDYDKTEGSCLHPYESQIITGKRSSPSDSPLSPWLGPVTDNHELKHRCAGCGRDNYCIVNAESFRDASVGSPLHPS